MTEFGQRLMMSPDAAGGGGGRTLEDDLKEIRTQMALAAARRPARTVSYTHLDVYKRQILNVAIIGV